VNLKALEYADRAIAQHPDQAGGYLSACISKGRLALFCDNRTKVRLAKEAQDAAATALRLGPDNDLAHHLMGRWHYEMSKLNVVVRTVVRVMYGTSLTPGTREEALAAYRRAVELAPHRLVHHVEAGRIALELGHSKAARDSLEAALQCEVEDINAWHTRMDAEMLLAQIDKRPWKQPSLVPPGIRSATPASLSTMALLGHSGTRLNLP
jgi:tetratricopeptide (TPR) repeat protein